MTIRDHITEELGCYLLPMLKWVTLLHKYKLCKICPLYLKQRIITEIKISICNTSFYSQMMNGMVFRDCHCKYVRCLTCPRLVVISKVPSSDLCSGTVSLPSGLTMQRFTSRPPWSHTNLVGNVRRDMVTCR